MVCIVLFFLSDYDDVWEVGLVDEVTFFEQDFKFVDHVYSLFVVVSSCILLHGGIGVADDGDDEVPEGAGGPKTTGAPSAVFGVPDGVTHVGLGGHWYGL